jgi:hypothetical protein
MRRCSPSARCGVTSPTSRATSSLRRKALANPNSSSIRSRLRATPVGQPGGGSWPSSRLTSSSSSGAFPCGAAPRARRIPRRVSRTSGQVVGEGWWAAAWAAAMAAVHRVRVAARNVGRPASSTVSAEAARYSATVSGSAGSGCSPWRSHHAAKRAKSLRYARRVLAARSSVR